MWSNDRLVCLIDKKPSVLIVDLPEQENEQFQIKKYGLWALKHAYNVGLVFNGLRVPAKNRLTAGRGDGLTIAYHGLNYGRVSLCAGAAGNMRMMLNDMLRGRTSARPTASRSSSESSFFADVAAWRATSSHATPSSIGVHG